VEGSSSNTAFPVAPYIPQFDGLRGVSILGVFAAHSEFLSALPYTHFLEYGRVGVDLFFVLSGFLITGILIDAKASPHYFRNFYARRALRIWPLYYLILTFLFLVTTRSESFIGEQTAHVWPYFYLYLQNLRLHLPIPYGLQPTWSLAIEEQFYLTWPLLVLLLRKRSLAIILVCASLFSLTLRIFGFEHGASLKFVHNFTLCRLDAIAFGCLAAIWLRSRHCTKFLWRRYSALFLLAGAVGVVAARTFFHQQSTVISYSFIAIGFTGLLGMALISDTENTFLGRFLAAGWLRYTGKISYGLYLIHMPIFLSVTAIAHNHSFISNSTVLNNLAGVAIEVLSAFLLASFSWRFLETPILRLKSYFVASSETSK
jgi:peptidoglycan/LPS O-acetylase OafA/YrhL